jgi:hypothetical protein
VTNPNALVVVVSQSGETADTLARSSTPSRSGHSHTLAICNVATSSMVRQTALTYLTRAGAEIGVASTKAFTTQLVSHFLLALTLAKLRNRLTAERKRTGCGACGTCRRCCRRCSRSSRSSLPGPATSRKSSTRCSSDAGCIIRSRSRGALKLKEISYIHAEAYPAGELKHGPLALVDADMPVVAIAPNDALLEKLKSNLQEVRRAGGELYVVADLDSHLTSSEGIHVIRLPQHAGHLSPIVHYDSAAALAYHAAVIRGTGRRQAAQSCEIGDGRVAPRKPPGLTAKRSGCKRGCGTRRPARFGGSAAARAVRRSDKPRRRHLFRRGKAFAAARDPAGYATAVWPPSGIAVAALLLLGNRAWPGVWAGAALVNFTVETSIFPAVAIGCGNSLEALTAAMLVRRQIGVLYEFESGEDVVRFVAIAASSAIIGATIGVSTIALHDPVAPAEFAAELVDLVGGRRRRHHSRHAAHSELERARAARVDVAKDGRGSGIRIDASRCRRLFLRRRQRRFHRAAARLLIPPIIIWAAFRLGQREVTLASVAACSVAIWYTVKGRGPFALASLNETLLLLLAFVSTVVMTGSC